MPPYHYQQAPWNFQCSYRHCCPHLQGLSTQWAFEEYQRSYDEHLEHWKVRQIQQEELEKALDYIEVRKTKRSTQCQSQSPAPKTV